MCFGESFYYTMASPLVVGQSYTVSMNVCVGILGPPNFIVGGLHSFMVIGLLNPPTNCGGPYGNVCSTPGATTILSGTQNAIGWVNFTNTFTATSALRTIVIGNCDNTGNGGNLFCSFSLTSTVILPAEIKGFTAESNGCEVKANWSVAEGGSKVERFELVKTIEGSAPEVVGTMAPQSGRSEYALTDVTPAIQGTYQLRIVYESGEMSQSEVVEVVSDCEDLKNLIEGNPIAGSEAILRFHHTGEPTNVTISNLEGRIVHQESVPAGAEGWVRHSLNVSALESGIYFVRAGSGSVAKLQIAH